MMTEERIALLKDSVHKNLPKDTPQIYFNGLLNNVNFWLETAIEAYDSEELQLGKGCINRVKYIYWG